MPNFNIVEGDDLFENVKQGFLTDYQDGVKAKDIIRKYDLTQSQYQNFRRRLVRSGEITTSRNPNAGQKKTPAKGSKKNPRNYYYNRWINRIVVIYADTYYACFRKEKQAVRFVELMREHDWDKEKVAELKRRVY